ncbi:MAG: tat (twin-arginine translocation) pathway signal sequence, partial [Pseudomonas putida]
NELAYQHFGYEGASFPKGGYLMRGFNDLKWLPAAPTEASPPAFS